MTEIHLRSISKSFGSRPVLEGVDLSVPDRAMLALLGPSGCGKTTLLRLIAGFERADKGSIAFGETVVESESRFLPPERRHIGYVPQEGSLFPHLSVAGNIRFGLPRGKDRADRVEKMLQLSGLSRHRDKFPHELSGGQQQRAALARALAPEPGVILLDEPFNALDLDLRRRMSEEVIDLLRQTATTTILVTHDPVEAFVAADLVALMQEGSIVQCGTPLDVYRRPVNIDAARLTGPAIILEAMVNGNVAETVIGPVALARQALADRRAATILLRPEQIMLAPFGEGREAAVLANRFRGDHTALTVQVGGVVLEIHASEPPAEDKVFLRVAGEAAGFFAHDVARQAEG